jgi:hypothetical protein
VSLLHIGIVDHLQYDGHGRIDELPLGPIQEEGDTLDPFPYLGREFHAERFNWCHDECWMSAEEGGAAPPSLGENKPERVGRDGG